MFIGIIGLEFSFVVTLFYVQKFLPVYLWKDLVDIIW